MTRQQRNLRNMLVVLAATLVVGSFAIPAFNGCFRSARASRERSATSAR
jgi:hypothetical protein